MFRATMKPAQMDGFPSPIISRSAQETRNLGISLGKHLSPGDVVLLTGTLGAGKSVFARGIAESLGATHWRGSPTFNLIHQYRTEPALAHADLYRLDGPEVEELGLEEYSHRNGVLVVEWADRAEPYLITLATKRTFLVTLDYSGEVTRQISLHVIDAAEPASIENTE